MPKDLTNMLKGSTNYRADSRSWVISKEDTRTNMFQGTALVREGLYGYTNATPPLTQFNKPICFNKGTKILCWKNKHTYYTII